MKSKETIPARRVQVGREWDGDLSVTVEKLRLLRPVVIACAALLVILGSQSLVTEDAALADRLLAYVGNVTAFLLGVNCNLGSREKT